ncbi:MSHA pilin protein MshD [Marinobacter oulmenensis]|uniref:MSHA pilin protein MshD n=2 Tax=Marinobacter oulmenensis TaxID=643747 RepID=A0A840UNP5_9GAMM|nr:MSHA pilin protein MshD [Marinobacter oulmenensis]
MTIVIISVAISGVVGAYSLIVGRSADPLNQTRAVALAQRYMDEILAKPFDEAADPGEGYGGGCRVTIDPSRDRDDYRDVDDYDAINSEVPSSYWDTPSTPQEGGYELFRVSVSVTCVNNPTSELGVDVEVKRIDITITDPSGNKYLFTAYRGNF